MKDDTKVRLEKAHRQMAGDRSPADGDQCRYRADESYSRSWRQAGSILPNRWLGTIVRNHIFSGCFTLCAMKWSILLLLTMVLGAACRTDAMRENQLTGKWQVSFSLLDPESGEETSSPPPENPEPSPSGPLEESPSLARGMEKLGEGLAELGAGLADLGEKLGTSLHEILTEHLTFQAELRENGEVHLLDHGDGIQFDLQEGPSRWWVDDGLFHVTSGNDTLKMTIREAEDGFDLLHKKLTIQLRRPQ